LPQEFAALKKQSPGKVLGMHLPGGGDKRGLVLRGKSEISGAVAPRHLYRRI